MRKRIVCLKISLFFCVFAAFAGCAPDQIASALTGRACNSAYLYDGSAFCPQDSGPPPPQPYCTQGLEGVTCWARPDLMAGIGAQVAQGPVSETPTQMRARTGF